MPNLDDLLSQLPQCGMYPSLQQSFSVRHPNHVRYLNQSNPRFVPPPLSEVVPIQPGITSVVLLSASAAVGKSTLAAEIAFRQGASLWNLAHFNVGTNSFTGTLLAAFGATALPTVMGNLTSGGILIVVDALDEGALRAGYDNFEQFLRDITQYVASPTARPVVIMLARTETADFVQVFFDLLQAEESRAIPYARYTIDFFEKSDAYIFTEKYLDIAYQTKGLQALHRSYQKPFRDAREILFRTAYRTLDTPGDPWSDPRVRGFLGYAPVLEGLAEILAVTNFQSLRGELAALLDQVAPGRFATERFLTGVTLKLLRREQDKAKGIFQERLGAAATPLRWSRWDTLYSVDEQVARVVCSALSAPVPETFLADLPGRLKKDYEEVVVELLPSHPFRGNYHNFANPVFQDFSYAWALLKAPGLGHRLIDLIARSTYLPSPLLAWFYVALADAQGTEMEIPAESLGLLYEAFLSQATQPEPVSLDIVYHPDTPATHAVFSSPRLSRTFADVVARIPFATQPPSLRFWRRLQDAYISFNGTIVIGTQGRDFVIGPSVEIDCGRLNVEAPSIRVLSRADEGVTIVAQDYDSALRPAITLYNGKSLRVRWPNIDWPWKKYEFEAEQVDPGDADVQAAFTHLRRILARFRSGGFGGLTRARALVDNIGVGSTGMARDLRDYLLQQGILRGEGGLYRLDADRMERLGINWAHLRDAVISAELRDFLRGFLHQP